MVRQRLQNRSNLQIAIPLVVVFFIAASAILSAQTSANGLREHVFDLYTRLYARPAAVPPKVALIDIDAESIDRVGPWPWPRTALAGLVTAAEEAGAKAVVVTVPVDGRDPLSPEVAIKFWQRTGRADVIGPVLSQLPTNNAALAAAARDHAIATSVGHTPGTAGDWLRSDVLAVDWLTFAGREATGFVALRAAPAHGELDLGIEETSLVSVSALPMDPDGMVRRTPLLWSRNNVPTPTAALAGIALAEGPITVWPATRVLKAGGSPVAALGLLGQEKPIRLDYENGVRLWFPKDLAVPTVTAWRALDSGGSWTKPLDGKIVFIGESVSETSALSTPRGAMPVATIQALLADQLEAGDVLLRPAWTKWIEGIAALLFGLIALVVSLALRPLTSILTATLISISALSGTYFIFKNVGVLLDPLPVVFAAIAAPGTVLLVHIVTMLRGGDVARATFHGALPAKTVAQIQSKGPGKLLSGVRRPVTVLSCGLQLPPTLEAAYKDRPADYISLTGAFMDALRNTVLNSGGTVDYAEDGRLLGYWNVPEKIGAPIERACGCGLKMIEELNRLAENMQSANVSGIGAGGFADTKLEVGIAHGECFAGALGHGNRKRYAVIGAAVDLASRLRSKAHLYGPAVITDARVFDALRHQYAFLDLDVLPAETGDNGEMVYGLSGNSFLKASKAFRSLADIQRELVLAWRNGDLNAATIQLQHLRAIPGVPDSFIELYEKRITEARNNLSAE